MLDIVVAVKRPKGMYESILFDAPSTLQKTGEQFQRKYSTPTSVEKLIKTGDRLAPRYRNIPPTESHQGLQDLIDHASERRGEHVLVYEPAKRQWSVYHPVSQDWTDLKGVTRAQAPDGKPLRGAGAPLIHWGVDEPGYPYKTATGIRFETAYTSSPKYKVGDRVAINQQTYRITSAKPGPTFNGQVQYTAAAVSKSAQSTAPPSMGSKGAPKSAKPATPAATGTKGMRQRRTPRDEGNAYLDTGIGDASLTIGKAPTKRKRRKQGVWFNVGL